MKKVFSILTCGLVLAFFANCGKNNDDGPKASPDMSSMCYMSNRMNNNNMNGMNTYGQPIGGTCNYPYAQAANVGFSPVSNGFNYTSGFNTGFNTGFNNGFNSMGSGMCSGSNQSQVYSASKGLGCVDNSRLTLSGQPVIYTLNQMTNSFTVTSAPNPYFMQQNQFGNNTGFTTGYNNNLNSYLPQGDTQVLRACDGGDNCPGGQACRSPMGPQMSGVIGICYF